MTDRVRTRVMKASKSRVKALCPGTGPIAQPTRTMTGSTKQAICRRASSQKILHTF